MNYVKISLLVVVGSVVLYGSDLARAQTGMDNKIQDGKKVTIEFSITLPESNTVIPNNVAQFVPGQKQLIPALEQALVGLKPGDTTRVDLPPDKAFGPYDDNKKKTIARDELPPNSAPGEVLKDHNGQPFTVVEMKDTAAVVDYNHPLAGKRLVFDVKVLDVQPRS
jgi:FKBP-type peptidyl-prolyl cis-trans isomerase 2